MSVLATNELQDVGIARIESIKIQRRGPKHRVLSSQEDIQAFVQKFRHHELQWSAADGCWTSTGACREWNCFWVKVKP